MAKRGVRLVFGLLFSGDRRLGGGRRDHVLRASAARRPWDATPRWCCGSTTICTRCPARASRSCSKATADGIARGPRAPAQGQGRPAREGRADRAGRHAGAALGQGAGGARRDPRLPQVRQAGLSPSSNTAASASTTSRRAADKIFLMPSSAARSHRRGHLRGVPARHARQDRRRIPTSCTSATTRPRRTSSPRRASRRRTAR